MTTTSFSTSFSSLRKSLRLSDHVNVSAASLSMSGKRSSMKPLNVHSLTKESIVPQSASMVASEMEANGQRYAADISSIKEAHERIKPYIHKTPVLTSESLNSITGRSLFFKCECFQKGGAFKFRGACNAVMSFDAELAAKGVVTHSSGNHAAALSLAAKIQGIPAYIVVPEGAPKCKVDNVIRHGRGYFQKRECCELEQARD